MAKRSFSEKHSILSPRSSFSQALRGIGKADTLTYKRFVPTSSRYVYVRWPMKTQSWCTRERAKKVCVILFFVACSSQLMRVWQVRVAIADKNFPKTGTRVSTPMDFRCLPVNDTVRAENIRILLQDHKHGFVFLRDSSRRRLPRTDSLASVRSSLATYRAIYLTRSARLSRKKVVFAKFQS